MQNIKNLSIVFLCYFLPAKLGFLLALPPDDSTAIWPVSGIASAAVLLLGYRNLPAVFLASLLVNLMNFTSLYNIFTIRSLEFMDVSSGIAIAATVESFTVAFIIKKLIGYPSSLSHWKDILILFLVAGLIGSIPSPSIGVTSLYLKGIVPASGFFYNWWTWWIGNSLGIIVCTPILVAMFSSKEYISVNRKIFVAVPLVVVFATVIVLFSNASRWEHERLKKDLSAEVDNAIIQMEGKFRDYLEKFTSINRFYFAYNQVDKPNFQYLVGIVLNKFPELYGFIWAPRIELSDKDQFISKVIKEGFSDYKISGFSGDDDSAYVKQEENMLLPVYYTEYQVSTDRNGFELGYDLYSDPKIVTTVDAAIKTRKTQVSDLISLDNLLDKTKVMLILDPVFPSVANYSPTFNDKIVGFNIGIFKFDYIFKKFITDLKEKGIEVEIFDNSSSANEKVLVLKSVENMPMYLLNKTATITFGNKTFEANFKQTKEYLVAHKEWHLWYLLLAGLFFTAIAAILIMIITGYSDSIEKLVHQKTKDLKESETRFQLAVEGANDGIWDWKNIQQDEQYWSPQFFKLLGYADQEIVPTYTHFLSLIHPDDVDMFKKAIEEHFNHNKPFSLEYRLRKKSGEYRWFQTKGSLTEDSETNIVRMTGAISDITDRKGYEKNLKEAKEEAESATKMKSDFLATMSHELRTPMNGIIGITELALDTSLTDQQRNYLKDVLRSAEHLLEILNDILDFSKIEAGQMELDAAPFDLKKAVQEVVALSLPRAAKKGLKLAVNFEDGFNEFLIGDQMRVRQVLHNLVGNSVKFTEKGGVTITVANQPNFTPPPGKSMVMISIKDTGIGLTKEQRRRIFNKFVQADSSTTRKYGGTGLGLSICQMFVNLFGGEISVDSEPGQGSTFSFTMLLDKSNSDSVKKNTIEEKTDLDHGVQGPIRVVLAEDNRINAEFAKEMLEKLKCEVLVARNGLEAVELLKNDRNFNLIFMDCQMPIMDGFEATAKIIENEKQANQKHIPIIALTANAMKGDREKCLASGMNDYLSKPVRQKDFATTIGKWLKDS